MAPHTTRDITTNYHRGNPFSTAAHDSIRPVKTVQRERITRYLAEHPEGATCDELEQALGLSHQAASARCTELLAAGHIEWRDNNKRRTRTGRWARVYHTPDTAEGR